MNGNQMGQVAMLVFRVITINHPLLQLAPATDLGTDQAIPYCGDLLSKRLIDVQNLGRGRLRVFDPGTGDFAALVEVDRRGRTRVYFAAVPLRWAARRSSRSVVIPV